MSRHVPFRLPSLFLSILALGCALAASPATAGRLEVVGPAGAAVSVDGRDFGALPLSGPVDLAAGRHVVTCDLAGHKLFRQQVEIRTPDEVVRLTVRMTPFSRRTAVASNVLLAGLGHFHLDRPTRGWAYAGAEVGGLLFALVGEAARTNARDDHLLILDQYRAAINAEEILRLRAAAEGKYNDMQDAEDMRDLGLMVAGAAVVVSMLDAWLTFPGVEVGPGPVPPQAGLPATLDTASLPRSLHAGVRLTF